MKILMAWEVGRNLGHVTKLANLAQEIKNENKKAEIYFALKNPGKILSYIKPGSHHVLQAPHYTAQGLPKSERLTLIYSDDLKACGYMDPEGLAGLVKSWQELYDLIQPDALIAQAAPTALLAAQKYKFKKIAFGGGYDVPIRTSPLPPLVYWEDHDPKKLAKREKLIVDNINEALKILKLPKIKHFADAIACDREYITSFEELDHYPERASHTKEKPTYCGPNYTMDNGAKVAWSSKSQKHIFAYIQFKSNAFKPTIEALMTLREGFEVIVAAPNIPALHKEEIEKKAPYIRIFDEPVKLSNILKNCDLGISHASSGISSAFAAHGIPQLVLPQHLEQFMSARALGRNKLARGVMGEYGTKEVGRLLHILLKEAEYKEAATNFAKKYATHTPEKTNQAIAIDFFSLMKNK